MANVRSPYYRKMYLIGVYSPLEEGEQLLALCDNAKQFADLMGITEEDANMILFRIFNKKTNFIRFFNKNCSVEFINVNLFDVII